MSDDSPGSIPDVAFEVPGAQEHSDSSSPEPSAESAVIEDPFTEALVQRIEEAPENRASDVGDDALAFARYVAEAAKTQGFDSVEKFLDAEVAKVSAQQAPQPPDVQQQAEQQWLRQAQVQIAQELEARVLAGELTRDQANEIFQRDVELAGYRRAHQTQAIDLTLQGIDHEIHQATTANPLLSEGDGIVSTIIKPMVLAGLIPDTKSGLALFSRLAQAIETKAVADYVAGHAAKNRNAAPVINPGGGAVPPTTSRPPATGDWADFLFRRAGFR